MTRINRTAAKATLLLALLVGPVAWLVSCGGPAPGSGVGGDGEFRADVYAAIAEIERRGLGEWAAYGRGMVERIVYDPGAADGGDRGATTVWLVGEHDTIVVIYLGDKWAAKEGAGRGEVLLHELLKASWPVGEQDQAEAAWPALQTQYRDGE